ncbi:3' terminal RNA ribose 2'-O-methyltransferase Hen1, partial [Streptomyces erythrochromogenes]
HGDHRFEWTREEFRAWAGSVAERFGYTVAYVPVGDDDPEVGPPTQMAVFTQEAVGDTDTATGATATGTTTTDSPKEGEAA